jgi:hypothetical protein
MKRFFFALFFVFAPLLANVARAQTGPSPSADTAAVIERGIQEMNNSGEVGTVTLSPVGQNQTLVVVELRSFLGRPQPAHIHRGKTCDAIEPKPVFTLHDVVSFSPHIGHSDTIVNYPIDRLLSGNYVIDVHTSDVDRTHDLACGELYFT